MASIELGARNSWHRKRSQAATAATSSPTRSTSRTRLRPSSATRHGQWALGWPGHTRRMSPRDEKPERKSISLGASGGSRYMCAGCGGCCVTTHPYPRARRIYPVRYSAGHYGDGCDQTNACRLGRRAGAPTCWIPGSTPPCATSGVSRLQVNVDDEPVSAAMRLPAGDAPIAAVVSTWDGDRDPGATLAALADLASVTRVAGWEVDERRPDRARGDVGRVAARRPGQHRPAATARRPLPRGVAAPVAGRPHPGRDRDAGHVRLRPERRRPLP